MKSKMYRNGVKRVKGIYLRKDGRYEAKLKIKKKDESSGAKYTSLYSKNIKRLQEDVEDTKEELSRKAKYKNTDMLVEQWSYIWLNTYKSRIQTTTRSSYDTEIRKVNKEIGNKPVSEVLNMDVQEMFNKWIDMRHNKNYLKHIRGLIFNMFEKAKDNNMIEINPVKGISLRGAKEPDKVIALNREEQRYLMDYLEKSNHFYREMYVFMLFTGLRLSETQGLEWGDIDFANREINLSRVFFYTKGNYKYEKSTKSNFKNASSKRMIPLSELAYDMLISQKNKLNMLKDSWSEKTEHIFITRSGKMPTPEWIRRSLGNVANKIRLEGFDITRTTPHVLRHTFTSNCYNSGIDILTISRFLGHVRIETTADIYTDIFEDKLKANIKKLDYKLLDKDQMKEGVLDDEKS